MAFFIHVHQWPNSQHTWTKTLCVCVVCQVKMGPYSSFQMDISRIEKEMVNDGLSNFANTIPDLIQKKFGNSKKKFRQSMRGKWIGLWRFFNPNFLEKEIIVFLINFQNSHWAATFVFNSGDDPHPFGQGMKEPLRTYVFRYCSLHPSGTRRIPIKHGIIWFLKICFQLCGATEEDW